MPLILTGMDKTIFSWQIAGYAGEGIKKIGQLFSKIALRSGFHTFDYTEYPSLIRGGHNVYQVGFGNSPVLTQQRHVDLMLAMNADGIRLHGHEFHESTVILYDSEDDGVQLDSFDVPGTIIDIPMVSLAREVGAERIAANMVALGTCAYLCSFDTKLLDDIVQEIFGHKSQKIVELNIQAAQAGIAYIRDKQPPLIDWKSSESHGDRITITGNEALSLGAIAGGMKAYFAYPMTPSSSILHTLADWSSEADVFVKHAEDEIGVINMALGASYAGVRAAVGTSGGGICYMSEAVGYAGIAELPLVIYESQRPGPAVGMPTWTGQADLLFCTYISQDEFPRIVLAPGDVNQAFDLSRRAFQLAEKYQIPVIVLSDKHLSESAQSCVLEQTTYSIQPESRNDSPQLTEHGMYPRYVDRETGISPRTIPGQPNGYYVSNGYETDDYGFATEAADIRIMQMDKRMRKLDAIRQEMDVPSVSQHNEALATLVGWGSSMNVLMAAQKLLVSSGMPVDVIHLSWMWPFPADQMTKLLVAAPTPILFEGNSTFQLGQLLRSQTGIDIYHKRGKYDGRPFYVEEVVTAVREVLA